MAKKKKATLLDEALKKIKQLTLQLEATDRRKEAAREKKGTSRYHVLVKERAIALLKEGKSKEEVSAALGVSLGALAVWSKGLSSPIYQTKGQGKGCRKSKKSKKVQKAA